MRPLDHALGLTSLLVIFGCSGSQPAKMAIEKAAAPSAPTPAPGVIDDFEDRDLMSDIGASWSNMTDTYMGGASVLSVNTNDDNLLVGDGDESASGLHFSYKLAQGASRVGPFAMLTLPLRSSQSPDVSSFSGVRYSYKGAAHTFRIETADISDYDTYGVPLPASDTWQTVELPWRFFEQRGFGKSVPFDIVSAIQLSFLIIGEDGDEGQLAIDDVSFLLGEPEDGNPLGLPICERVEIPRDDIKMVAYYYLPKGKGPHPALVVLPGGTEYSVGQVWPHYKLYGRRMAERGYVVMVLDYASSKREFLDPKQVEDISAAVDNLKTRSDVDLKGLFLIGFSMGGSNALRVAASRNDLSGVVTYFAPVDWPMNETTRPVDKPVISYCETISAPVLILQGDKDAITNPEQARILLDKLTSLGKKAELIMYEGAGHGFTYVDTPAVNIEYNEAAAQSSFDAVSKFIQNNMSK